MQKPPPKPVTSTTQPLPPSQPPTNNVAPASVVDFVSHSVNQTHKCGLILGRLLMAGDVVLLMGDLGAGKTSLTKGIAEGLGVEGYVNSPTFTLVNEYEGRLPVYHLDAYRLESSREAIDFGIEEYLYGEGVTIIEWPERLADLMPEEHLTVKLGYLNETKRTLRLEPSGPRYAKLVADFKAAAFGVGR